MSAAVPSSPIADLHFRWPWRPYQQRVLDELELVQVNRTPKHVRQREHQTNLYEPLRVTIIL